MAVLPALVVVAVAAWQVVLAGWAAVSAESAARAGARAVLAGSPARPAALAALPGGMRAGARVQEVAGRLIVRVGVPDIIPGLHPAVEASAALVRQ